MPGVTRPPLPWLLAYRLFGARLPSEYRGWAAQDIASKGFVNWRSLRTFLTLILLCGCAYVGRYAFDDKPGFNFLKFSVAGSGVIALLGSRNTYMRRALRFQRIDRKGNPVSPKGLGLLDNLGAAALTVALLVVVTAGAAVYADLGKPPGCGKTDEATLGRIRAAFSKPGTTLNAAAEVSYGGSNSVIAASVSVPGQPNVRFVYWLVEGDTIYEITGGKQQGVTSFDRPTKVDGVITDPLIRAATCIQERSAIRP